VCSIDGFVDWESNRYAVPCDHVTDLLAVRITQRELFVYAADLTCVAHRALAPRGAGLKLDPQGLHPPPRGKSPVDLPGFVEGAVCAPAASWRSACSRSSSTSATAATSGKRSRRPRP
jgi:hypothetical protein